MAALCCACTRRSAMRARSRVIGTRCSARPDRVAARRRNDRCAAGGVAAGWPARGAGSLEYVRLSGCALRGALPVTCWPRSSRGCGQGLRAAARPPLPDQASSARRRSPHGFGPDRMASSVAAAVTDRAVLHQDLAPARRPPAPAPRAPPCRFRGRPGSRRAPTRSPGCLRQATRVASATDSGSAGTLISRLMTQFFASAAGCRLRCGLLDCRGFERGAHRERCCSASWIFARPVRRRRRGHAAGVVAPAGARPPALQLVADLVPGALVLRLFLAPDDLAGPAGSAPASPRYSSPGRDRAARCARCATSLQLGARAAPSSRSKYTLPLQKTTRSHLCGLACSSISSMTAGETAARRDPPGCDTDSSWRSRLLGVITISGLR